MYKSTCFILSVLFICGVTSEVIRFNNATGICQDVLDPAGLCNPADPTIWIGGKAPGDKDDAIIEAYNATDGHYFKTLENSTWKVQSLTIIGPNLLFKISNNSKIETLKTIFNAIITVSGSLEVTGNADLQSGTLESDGEGHINVTGELRDDSASSVQLSDSAQLWAKDLTLQHAVINVSSNAKIMTTGTRSRVWQLWAQDAAHVEIKGELYAEAINFVGQSNLKVDGILHLNDTYAYLFENGFSASSLQFYPPTILTAMGGVKVDSIKSEIAIPSDQHKLLFTLIGATVSIASVEYTYFTIRNNSNLYVAPAGSSTTPVDLSTVMLDIQGSTVTGTFKNPKLFELDNDSRFIINGQVDLNTPVSTNASLVMSNNALTDVALNIANITATFGACTFGDESKVVVSEYGYLGCHSFADTTPYSRINYLELDGGSFVVSEPHALLWVNELKVEAHENTMIITDIDVNDFEVEIEHGNLIIEGNVRVHHKFVVEEFSNVNYTTEVRGTFDFIDAQVIIDADEVEFHGSKKITYDIVKAENMTGNYSDIYATNRHGKKVNIHWEPGTHHIYAEFHKATSSSPPAWAWVLIVFGILAFVGIVYFGVKKYRERKGYSKL